MNQEASNHPDEKQLVRLYMEVTGAAESAARNVFMYVCYEECAPNPGMVGLVLEEAVVEEEVEPEVSKAGVQAPRRAVALGLWLWLVAALFLVRAQPGAEVPASQRPQSETEPRHVQPPPPSNHTGQPVPSLRSLTLADAINLALHQNPDVLRAQKDIQAAQGIAVQTRALALPSLGITGGYTAAQRTDVDVIQGQGFTFGTPQNWSTQLKLVQSLYEGGRMLSAIRAARLTKQQSWLKYQTVLADTILAVQVAFYDVLLASQQIIVQEASVELLNRELADTNRRFQAGTVPRFNVLRAEVELANARPRLISARNNFRISKNNLANLLGLNLPNASVEEIPINVIGTLQAEPYEVDLSRAVSTALQQRTELGTLRKAYALRKEDLVTARSGYKPRLDAYVGYDAHNSILSQDLTDELHGWIAGAQLSWNLFDGLRTQGRIAEASANYERAGIDLDDMARRIELDVRTAYSNFIEAREVLETQKKVQEEAEEALRLARARNEAGTGTQLDVLSAQTALTEARTTQIQALHDYEAARARLQRALGNNVPTEPGK